MKDNCQNINPKKGGQYLFDSSSGRCTQNNQSTTTTTTTSTTTTSTSSTTTTTTTLAPQTFTIDNNSSYDDLYYLVYSDTQLYLDGFVNSGGEVSESFNSTEQLTIYVYQFSEEIMYVEVTLSLTGESDDVDNYATGVTNFQFNNVDGTKSQITITIEDVSPITTTTTTSTTSTTSTSTSTTTTTTTSTSTTTTTTSSTTTTTTTTAPDPLDIQIENTGPTLAVGVITEAWNVKTNPIPPATQTSYYAATSATILSGNTEVEYNSTVGAGNKTRFKLSNTGASELYVSIFFSDNNGSSWTMLDSYYLSGHPGGTAPYDFVDAIYNTPPNNTGVKNIIEARVYSL